MFFQPQQTTTGSSFGTPRTTNTFANASNPPPFGNTTNPSNSAENFAFTNAGVATPTAFGVPSPGNAPPPFGNAIEPPEKFGNNTGSPFISTAAAPSANNPFLQKTQVGQSPGSRPRGNEILDESMYSTDEDLSETDKGLFSQAFTLGHIPIKPPTIAIR